MNDVELNNLNSGNLGVRSSCPSPADDPSFISISPVQPQRLLGVAYSYSCKWGFNFNASKSCVLTFWSSATIEKVNSHGILDKQKYHIKIRTTIWTFNLLFITVHSKCQLSIVISDACKKGKRSYFALFYIGSKYLRQWLTSIDVKFFLSDISESLINVQYISAEIDTRKLLFLRRLCRLDYEALPKKIFLTLLMSFMLDLSNKRNWFISDIVTIIHLYDLANYLQDLLYNGIFITKDTWKKIVTRAVKSSYDKDRERSISYYSDFSFFRKIYSKFMPASIWILPTTPDKISLCKFVAKLCTKVHPNCNENLFICVLCNRAFTDVFSQWSFTCPDTFYLQNRWWSEIVNSFDISLVAELSILSEDDLYMILIGCRTFTPLNNTFQASIYLGNFRFYRSCASHYFRVLHSTCT
jgi:hypothetical protein